MEINQYTKEIESMTEEEAIEKFGQEVVDELLRENAEYASENEWYLYYTARTRIPNHNAWLEITYTVDKEETYQKFIDGEPAELYEGNDKDEIDDDDDRVTFEEKLEEDYDWSDYKFSVPDWDDEEEKIWAEQHAK